MIVNGKIRCSKCETFKPLSMFALSIVKVGCGRCKPCHTKNAAKKRLAPERQQQERELTRKSMSGTGWARGLRTLCKKGTPDTDITVEWLRELWNTQGGKCALSGLSLSTQMIEAPGDPLRVSCDQIQPAAGYYKRNVRLVCCAVNKGRRNHDDDRIHSVLADWAVSGFMSRVDKVNGEKLLAYRLPHNTRNTNGTLAARLLGSARLSTRNRQNGVRYANGSARKAREMPPVTIDAAWINARLAKGICSRTGISLFAGQNDPFMPSLDRKISAGANGYTPDNAQVVCQLFNLVKGAWTDRQALTILKAWASHCLAQREIQRVAGVKKKAGIV